MSKDREEPPACDEHFGRELRAERLSRVEARTLDPLNPEPLNLKADT